MKKTASQKNVPVKLRTGGTKGPEKEKEDGSNAADKISCITAPLASIPPPEKKEKKEKQQHSSSNLEAGKEDASAEARREQKRKANEWAMSVLSKGVDTAIQEYKNVTNQYTKEQAKTFCDHPAMNRYDNIFCLDATRVKVPTGTASDYYHANYVGVPPTSPKAYICAQGPMENTKERFWRMVVKENVEMVVMLCEFVEKGREKCYRYIPTEQNEKVLAGPVTVTCVGKSEMDTGSSVAIVVRTLSVVLADKTLLVRHFSWMAWPDHGVPTSTQPVIRLLSKIKVSKSPVIIHCSAGIGRTGTFVMTALAQECLKKATSFEGVPWLLSKVREQRAKAVQNDVQYVFIYRCLVDYLVARGALCKEGNELLEKFYKDIDAYIVTSRKKAKEKNGKDGKQAEPAV